MKRACFAFKPTVVLQKSTLSQKIRCPLGPSRLVGMAVWPMALLFGRCRIRLTSALRDRLVSEKNHDSTCLRLAYFPISVTVMGFRHGGTLGLQASPPF